jgi:hypothetical protein
VSTIEISTGTLDRPYKVLGSVKARVTSGSGWNKARTTEDADSKLREVALRTYPTANAIINVTYQRGISATSWKALTATGTAVLAESDEKVCPHCAETIKAAAKVCRFCGKDVV